MSQRPKLKPNWSEHWNTVRNSTKLAEEQDEKQECTSASSAWWMFASRSASELQARGGCSNSPIKPNEGSCPRTAEPWPCTTFSSYLQFFVLKQLNSTNKRQLIYHLSCSPCCYTALSGTTPTTITCITGCGSHWGCYKGKTCLPVPPSSTKFFMMQNA